MSAVAWLEIVVLISLKQFNQLYEYFQCLQLIICLSDLLLHLWVFSPCLTVKNTHFQSREPHSCDQLLKIHIMLT